MDNDTKLEKFSQYLNHLPNTIAYDRVDVLNMKVGIRCKSCGAVWTVFFDPATGSFPREYFTRTLCYACQKPLK